MVDDKFRSDRNHDTVAREGSEQTSPRGIGNLLAQLARLTGCDPCADGGRAGASSAVDNRDSVAREGSEQTSRGGIGNLLAELARLTGQGDPYADDGRDGASSALDWAADDASPGQRQQGKDQYVALSRPQPSPVFSRIRPAETIGGRFLPSPQAPTLLLTASDDRHDGDIQAAKIREAYRADDRYDDLSSPRRRDGLVIVIAVLGLAILGAVGVFAYRAVFGGAVLLALPALIEAENGPSKNVPNYGDARPSNSSQTSIASAGSSEKFVSRWPADIQEPPKKTAPISPNPTPPPSALGSGAVAPIAPVPAAPPPAVAPPATASVPPPAPVPAPPSSEPKKIHTVIIRSDGSGQTDTSAAAAPHSTTSTTAPEAKPSAAAVLPVGNQPLPLAPDAHGHAAVSPPSRSPMPVGTGTAAEAFSGGGYAVQVASERSAADAHAVFRTLQAKFPNQLGGREPIVRRTDLGAEGIYYRVIVGPFASIEEAAGVCSTLKAAGGNCRVERD
jgi:hypothetical protein